MSKHNKAHIANRSRRQPNPYRYRAVFGPSKPAYTGASDKRSLESWGAPFGTADSELLPALPTLRNRSRDLYRNTPVARGVIKTMKRGVLGAGLQLQAAIDKDFLNLTEEEAMRWQANAEQEFRLWAESRECDFMRQQTFKGLQKLASLSQQTAGDVFVLLPWVARQGVPYDLKVQFIEADRVCNPNDLPDTEQIAGGIERDSNGVPIAIHIRTPHPAAVFFTQVTPTWQRVPFYGPNSGRRNVLQLLNVERIGQTRGEPFLAPIIDSIKQISRYSEAELAAAVTNAMWSVSIKRPLVDTTSGFNYDYPVGEEPWTQAGSFQLGSGTILQGAPGEDIGMVAATRPSSQFDPFFLACIKQIAMAVDIPFEKLIKHFSSSYSASRAALLEAYEMFEEERDNFVEMFNQPIYEEFLTEAVIKGRIIAPGFLTNPAIRLAYSGAYWQGPAKPILDEVKEANAAILRVNNNLSTKEVEAQRLSGMSFKDIVRARGEELKLEREHLLAIAETGQSYYEEEEEDEDE